MPREKRPTVENINRTIRNAEILLAYQNGETVRNIAYRQGMSHGGVYSVLRANGAQQKREPRPPKPAAPKRPVGRPVGTRKAAILQDLKWGFKPLALAEKYGVSKQYVYWLDRERKKKARRG